MAKLIGFGRRVGHVGVVVAEASVVGAVRRVQRLTLLALRIHIRHGWRLYGE